MCMMLYLASGSDVPLRKSPDLTVEEVDSRREAVRRRFTLPVIRFIGAHTGCSCGFPAVSADVPIEFYAGMLDDNPDREADLKSVRALLALIRQQLQSDEEVQLYAAWNGEEEHPSKGTIELKAGDLVADEFFFNERFLYRISQ